MSLILFTSTVNVPGTLQPPVPRYEIGKFFVTIYHANRRVRYGDEASVKEMAGTLRGCLGILRPMFINQYHPSSPPERASGSVYSGTTEEVHGDKLPRLAHYHVELIGKDRDDGFTEEEITTLKDKLDSSDWA